MPWTGKEGGMAQRRACYAKAAAARKAGKTPTWDCKEWDRHSGMTPGKTSGRGRLRPVPRPTRRRQKRG